MFGCVGEESGEGVECMRICGYYFYLIFIIIIKCKLNVNILSGDGDSLAYTVFDVHTPSSVSTIAYFKDAINSFCRLVSRFRRSYHLRLALTFSSHCHLVSSMRQCLLVSGS